MGDWEEHCVACEFSHGAAAWFTRTAADGSAEYICGARYTNYTDKKGWRQIFPARDE